MTCCAQPRLHLDCAGLWSALSDRLSSRKAVPGECLVALTRQCCRYQAVNALVPVPLDKSAVLRARERFLKLATVFTLEQFLCGWFFGAPFSSLRRGNVEELIAYGFYTRRWKELTPEVSGGKGERGQQGL